jgi:hypothetical protein
MKKLWKRGMIKHSCRQNSCAEFVTSYPAISKRHRYKICSTSLNKIFDCWEGPRISPGHKQLALRVVHFSSGK